MQAEDPCSGGGGLRLRWLKAKSYRWLMLILAIGFAALPIMFSVRSAACVPRFGAFGRAASSDRDVAGRHRPLMLAECEIVSCLGLSQTIL